jgi:hypothetical protein
VESLGRKKTENIPEAKEKKKEEKKTCKRCIFHYKVFISLNRQTLIVSFKLAVDLTHFRTFIFIFRSRLKTTLLNLQRLRSGKKS